MEENKDEKENKTKLVVARIPPKLDAQINFWIEKKHLPKSRFAEMAFINQISKFENTFEYVTELINNQSSLMTRRDYLIPLFKDARKETLKEIVHILKDNNDIILQEYSEEEFVQKAEEINNKKPVCLLMLILANPNHKKESNSVSRVIDPLKKIETAKCRHVALEINNSIENEFRLLLFIKYSNGEIDSKKEEVKSDETKK